MEESSEASGSLNEQDEDIISAAGGVSYIGAFIILIVVNLLNTHFPSYLSWRGYCKSQTQPVRLYAHLCPIHQTFSAIESLLLAMLLFPDDQARAHEELDRVIGNDRLPELTDRDQLPYCSALCKENLRCVCI